MRGKMWFVAGLAAGYVLGTRAGRERYEELMRSARQLREHPTVQEAAGVVQEQANRLFSGGKEMVNEKLSQRRSGKGQESRVGEAAGQAPGTTSSETEDTLAGTTRRAPGTTP